MYFDATLPSLINGDDMFATFNSIPMERALPVWVYRFQTSPPIKIYQLSSSCNFFSAVSTSTSSSVCSSTWCSPCSSRSSWTPTRSSRTAMTKASHQIVYSRSPPTKSLTTKLKNINVQFYSTAEYDFTSGQYSGESVHRR